MEFNHAIITALGSVIFSQLLLSMGLVAIWNKYNATKEVSDKCLKELVSGERRIEFSGIREELTQLYDRLNSLEYPPENSKPATKAKQ